MSQRFTIQADAEPIPGYRLISRLGRGGYGEVWKAEAPGGILKAIKFVFGDLDGFGDDGQAAEQEFKSLHRVKSIRHPFVLSLERFEAIDGQLVIVMELADRNMYDRFSECVVQGLPGIPREELLRYMDEAAEALDLMNTHYQIQHLDIKPQNLFLVHQHVKVADFGLAKDLDGARAKVTGGVTPMYAPPETFEGWISRQSDQYSLAIVYQEMLTGRRPIVGSNTRQLIMYHMTGIPDVSPLASPDREAVARALSKTPGDRFVTCTDFVKALRGIGSIPAADDGAGTKDVALEQTSRPERAPAKAPSTNAEAKQSGRGLPALITPGVARSAQSAPITLLRRAATDTEVLSTHETAPPERLGDGVLFPAVFVGLGGTGLAILRELRQLVFARFGRPTLPNFRWLYLDTDPAATEAAAASGSVAALAAEDILHTPLQRPAHYLNRDGLPAIDAWLAPDTLYRIPRTPATDGVRALGRLALCDHYQSVVQRVRAVLEPFMKPEPLADAERQTKLGLRGTHPRVYVAAGLGGGTGSGMFIDVAYIVRRELRRLGFGTGQIVGLFAVPPLTPDARGGRAVANARAALTELNHFDRPTTTYTAHFDTREPSYADADRPFRRSVLVRAAAGGPPRENPPGTEAAAQVAYAEVLTAAGRAAHPDTAPPTAHPHALVGIRRVVWPRNPLVRATARQLVRETLRAWIAPTLPADLNAPLEAVQAQWQERRLDLAVFRTAIDYALAQVIGSPAETFLREVLQPFHASTPKDGPDASVAFTVFDHLLKILGRPGREEMDHPGRLSELLEKRVREMIGEADGKLASMIVSLLERPGLRVAAALDAVRILEMRLNDEIAVARKEAKYLEDNAVWEYTHLLPMLSAIAPGEGGRYTRRQTVTPDLVAQIDRWARTRYRYILARAVVGAYRLLLNSVPEYVREVNMCRGQIQAFLRDIDEPPQPAPRTDAVCHFLFPDGARTLEAAAANAVDALGTACGEFDRSLQAKIQRQFRALIEVCVKPAEHGPIFVKMLLDQANLFIEARTPTLSASQAIVTHFPDQQDLQPFIGNLVEQAAPGGLGAEATVAATVTVTGIPPDAAGLRLRDLIRGASSGSAYIATEIPDDILILRHSRNIPLAALPHLATPVETTTPSPAPAGAAHARTDVPWVSASRP